jgi:hypothetical protein
MGHAGALKILPRWRQLRIDTHGSLEFGDCLVHVTLPRQSAAEIIMRHSIVRFKFQQLTEEPDGICQLSRIGRRFAEHSENRA